MGLREHHLKYFFDVFELVGYEKLDGLKMCELGNQTLRKSGVEYGVSNGIDACKTGKELFTCFGFKHTSIDLNGEDGALAIDLSKPIVDETLLSNFDVVTNSGTTEHVLNQFECFKNIHNLCKDGGVFIHMVPSIEYRTINNETMKISYHGRYNYSFGFFRSLAIGCGYKLIDARITTNLISVAMRKTNNNNFISEQEFNDIPIYVVNGCE